MSKIFLLLAFLPFLSIADETLRARVVLRDNDFEPRIRQVELSDLLRSDRFEGRYFKIVKGKNDEAISTRDSDTDLVLRAATVYYHLTKARSWFVRELNSAYVEGLPVIVIRIEHTNQFNELGHFAHDNLEPQYNNALTIPAGTGIEGRGIRPWDMEIWFRPVKKVHIDDLKIKGGTGMGEWGGVLSAFRQQMHMTSLQRFLAQLVQAQVNPGAGVVQDVFGWESLVRIAGTSLILEAVYRYADPLSRAFSRKWFWLDTVLVPEIIYHEFAHVALSDHLVLSHSTAVIEGMADYFAGEIANSPNLATRIRDYNVFNGKKAERKQQYIAEFETTDYANTDFVFGMLWDLRAIVGGENSPRFIYALREKIDTNSSIRRQLIEGILQTCTERCEQPFINRLEILQRYNARGI